MDLKTKGTFITVVNVVPTPPTFSGLSGRFGA